MPDESNELLNYRVWETDVETFNYTDSRSEVREVRHIHYGAGYYVITMVDGSTLNMTRSHEALTKVEGGTEITWKRAESLVPTDELFRNDKVWVAIDDVNINTGKHMVHTINVEEEDVYFAGNFLMHNK